MSVEEKDLRAPEEERGSGRIGAADVGISVVVYFMVQIIVGAVLFGGLGLELGSTSGTLALVAAATLSSILAVGFVVAVRSGLTPASVGLRATSGRWLLAGAGVGLLAWAVNRGVIVLYIWLTGDASNPQAGLSDTAQGSLPVFALLVLLGGLLTPLGEELLFRGVLYGWLRRWGIVLATVISAVVFGLAHGVNVVLPAAIVLGVFSALLYEKSGSIWPAVVSHAVNNTLIFVLVRILAELGILEQASLVSGAWLPF